MIATKNYLLAGKYKTDIYAKVYYRQLFPAFLVDKFDTPGETTHYFT